MTPYSKLASILFLLAFVVLACSANKPETSNKQVEQITITAEPNEASRGALGQGFELHKEDLLSKQFKATGAKIFESLSPEECTVTSKLGTIERCDAFYSSTEAIYSSVASSTKVSGSLKGAYTMGASVSAVTNNIASNEQEVQGMSLILKAFSLSTGLKKQCINRSPLSQGLVADFMALENEINRPWRKSSWRKYEVFLSTYGSHIVKESISGSSIYQYVFAESSKSFSQQDLTVQACLSIAGPTNAGKVGFSACSGVSTSDINSATSSQMVKKLVVRGGKAETRADLVSGELTPEQINSFMKEAETDPSPIQYVFYPIWTILKARYIGTEHFAKATNLEQFYKGFLNYQCDNKEATTASNTKILMQRFELAADSEPEAPTYVCKLGKEGCHDDEDCHYRDAYWCECGGSDSHPKATSCLRLGSKDLVSGTRKQVCYTQKERGWGWHGCKLGGIGLSCYCSGPSGNYVEAWNGGDTDNALRDVHYAMLDKKRRDKAKKRHHVH